MERLNEIVTPHGMLVVGKALDVQEVPRSKGIIEGSLLQRHPASLDLDVFDFVAAEGEGEHGTALGNVDVVGGPFVRGSMVVSLPRGRREIVPYHGVIFEDEEEASLPEWLGLEGPLHECL